MPKFDKKFDVVVGNPPYQQKNEGEKKTNPLWHHFVKLSVEQCVDGGYVALIHPSGWRTVDGKFKEAGKLLKSKQMLYLEMHHFKEGQQVFGVAIDYDWYCLRNSKNESSTIVKFQDGTISQVELPKHEFLPNESFADVMSLVAKDNEEKVKVLHSFSAYEIRKNHMNKEKNHKFQHPCVYTVTTESKPTFWYSSTKNKGYFGIPKVIWAGGRSGVVVDKIGEFGLTQFAYAIVDDVENLDNIKKALQNKRFIEHIMGFKYSLGDRYNRKVIATFRKDFWKEFI